MADADWASYKQLRGNVLPQDIEFRGGRYRQEQLFKRDFYAATGLYRLQDGKATAERPQQIVLKIYHTQPFGILPLGWLGRRLCRCEVYYLKKADGIARLPRLLERDGPSGFVREYAPGCNLREHRKSRRPDEHFYPRLYDMLAAIYTRGIAHNDLSKPENILVLPDGGPAIIDFQIAGSYAWRLPLLRQLGRRLRSYMQSVDRYHLRKLHRRDRRQDFTPEELQQSRKKGLLLTLHGILLRRPYRAIRHFVLNHFLRARPPQTPCNTCTR